MPKKNIKFQDRWLSLTDPNGTIVSKWAQKHSTDSHSCICLICPNTSFKTEKGFDRLQQHAKTKQHILNLSKLKPEQILLRASSIPSGSSTERPSQTSSCESTVLQSSRSTAVPSTSCNQIRSNITVYNPKAAAVKAELLWCMETVVSCSSIASCAGKKQLFQVMFPNDFPEQFSLSPGKAQYLITEALGPYYQKQMLADVQHCDVLFSLLFDDTSNVKSKKELQIRIRFWSRSEQKIVCKHLVTYFLGKATGRILFDSLKKALDSNGLSFKQVLALGCDGPNVNKTVISLFQEELKRLKCKPLIDLGTCDIHIVHNGFLKGSNELSLDPSDFVLKIYYYFHHRDARCENFESIQVKLGLPTHKFIKHASTRWLTVGPASERTLEQLPALEEYFLRYVPKSEATTIQKKNYLEIRSYLKDVRLKSTLQFVVYAAKMFTTEFTLIMQKEEPLIHVLYVQLKNLLTILLSSIVKQSVLDSNPFNDLQNINFLLENRENFVDLLEINVGQTAKTTIESMTKKEQLTIMTEIKQFYVTAIKHIIKKIPSFEILKYFQCLSPENIKKPESESYITKIASLLPFHDLDVDILSCEWKLLQFDEAIRFTLNKDERIDSYWNHVFLLQGQTHTKYSVLKKVVQSALALSHGNADVERGFSKSSQILTEDKSSMSERTLNAKLAITDALKKYDNMVYKVPIVPELQNLAQGAYRSYQLYLEDQKRIAEENASQAAAELKRKADENILLNSIDEEKKTVKKLEKDLKFAIKSYEQAESDAESMQKVLKDATKKDITGSAMSEIVKSLEKLREKEKVKRKRVDELKLDIGSRKSKMINSVIKKRCL